VQSIFQFSTASYLRDTFYSCCPVVYKSVIDTDVILHNILDRVVL